MAKEVCWVEKVRGALRLNRKPREQLHCWADGPEAADGCGQTCMLRAGHRGPHEWTRDDDILLEFTPGEGF
jgi:hypothetical protein